MNITPHMIAGAYDFLRECPPYRGWKLPHSEVIEFRVVRDAGCYGYFQFNKRHIIGVNDHGVGHTFSLIKVTAHEMIHLHQYLNRLDSSGSVHNANFRKLSDQVCRLHGWDAKMFFI